MVPDRGVVVGLDDSPHQFVTHDVIFGERHVADPFDVGQQTNRFGEPGRLSGRKIDLAWVACGRVDGYYELGTHRWDRAAGELLVREAGGVVSRLDPVGDSGDGVLAAGPALHGALSGLVGAALLH